MRAPRSAAICTPPVAPCEPSIAAARASATPPTPLPFDLFSPVSVLMTHMDRGLPPGKGLHLELPAGMVEKCPLGDDATDATLPESAGLDDGMDFGTPTESRRVGAVNRCLAVPPALVVPFPLF